MDCWAAEGDADGLDLADVRGHRSAKRALERRGRGHNLLMLGPPGSGKSMLARRLKTILPPRALEEATESTSVWTVAGLFSGGHGLVRERPFWALHHTTWGSGLIGSGTVPHLGEPGPSGRPLPRRAAGLFRAGARILAPAD